ncbi:MAG: prepilin-type N-terminal cleavage/methylation domain-containing protein [Desulfobacterales bacterium]
MELLDMVKMNLISNRKGFTLLELMAVLVIMGVMASAGVKKYDRLSDTADITALKAGIRELNMQETLVWIQMKLSDTGWTSDLDVFNAVDKNLGQGYRWDPGPDISGGTLHYQSQSIALVRSESTRSNEGSWN